MKKIYLLFIVILTFVVLGIISTAYNYNVVYNAYTQRLDYFQTENYTGYNVTADNFFGNIASKYVEDVWVNTTGDTMTGNLTFSNTNGICYGTNCQGRIHWNGTSIIISVT